jgi:hypothetical protein
MKENVIFSCIILYIKFMILVSCGCNMIETLPLTTVSAVHESSSSCDYPLSSSMTIAELGFVSETMLAASIVGQLEEVRMF